jgi:acyl-CoA reductase-like NAD-dependent aldehyde dehydrogenase
MVMRGDVDRAVAAARAAFDGGSTMSQHERVELLERIGERYEARAAELVDLIVQEVGAPVSELAPLNAMLGLPRPPSRPPRSHPVLTDVTPDMTISRVEIFGPVVTLMAYENEEDAVRIANGTPYGLPGAVTSADHSRAARVARRLRTGMVHLNGAGLDPAAPFGGYKMSGNGRENGEYGIREFLEAKSIYGDNPA